MWVVAITSLRLLEGIRTDLDLLRVKFICRRVFFVLAGSRSLVGRVAGRAGYPSPPQEGTTSATVWRPRPELRMGGPWYKSNKGGLDSPFLSVCYYQFRSVCQCHCLSDFVCLSLSICLFPSLALSVRLSVTLAASQSLASLWVSPLSLPLEVLTYWRQRVVDVLRANRNRTVYQNKDAGQSVCLSLAIWRWPNYGPKRSDLCFVNAASAWSVTFSKDHLDVVGRRCSLCLAAAVLPTQYRVTLLFLFSAA